MFVRIGSAALAVAAVFASFDTRAPVMVVRGTPRDVHQFGFPPARDLSPTPSKYKPHQGLRERGRRLRQIAAGQLAMTIDA